MYLQVLPSLPLVQVLQLLQSDQAVQLHQLVLGGLSHLLVPTDRMFFIECFHQSIKVKHGCFKTAAFIIFYTLSSLTMAPDDPLGPDPPFSPGGPWKHQTSLWTSSEPELFLKPWYWSVCYHDPRSSSAPSKPFQSCRTNLPWCSM